MTNGNRLAVSCGLWTRYGGHDPRDPISVTIVAYSILPFVALFPHFALQFTTKSNAVVIGCCHLCLGS